MLTSRRFPIPVAKSFLTHPPKNSKILLARSSTWDRPCFFWNWMIHLSVQAKWKICCFRAWHIIPPSYQKTILSANRKQSSISLKKLNIWKPWPVFNGSIALSKVLTYPIKSIYYFKASSPSYFTTKYGKRGKIDSGWIIVGNIHYHWNYQLNEVVKLSRIWKTREVTWKLCYNCILLHETKNEIMKKARYLHIAPNPEKLTAAKGT